jgi:hypothetical protein
MKQRNPEFWEVPAFLAMALAGFVITLLLGQWGSAATIGVTAAILALTPGVGPLGSISPSHAGRLGLICALFAGLSLSLWILGQGIFPVAVYLLTLCGFLIRLGFVVRKKGWTAP